eukprot:CAMPEP_0172504634 /NCGR_PEP_ID=MMETSP1066-20121228/180438_1 /TAXON_ID=671091 /ORGANISM="Coscinodiscus wailesii, Strain CCMP2513" /LENGTH=295 /DNA_ID=CAMNT_0013280909 /DNA_START=69 /DNA_END=956 /DNA_ORIENTATION=-
MTSIQQEVVNLPEKLEVLLQQERTTYRGIDYLRDSNAGNQDDSTGESSPPAQGSYKPSVNALWREQICDWSYAIVDHFDLDRETVCISFSYLDRFIPRYKRPINHKTYQLAAMTTLYMAIKLYEPRKIGINSFISLSRGHFTSNHIVAMEHLILQTLSWHVHPPTPVSFVNHLLLLHPVKDTRLNDISRFLTELSVCDYFFVTRRPSSIALACILNAMEEVQSPSHVTMEFLETAKRFAPDIDGDRQDVFECQAQLKELYYASGSNSHVTQVDCSAPTSEREESVSPVCVSKMFA